MVPFYKRLKFWLPVATVGYMVLKHYFPTIPFLTEEWFQGVVLFLVAWLVGGPLEEGLRGAWRTVFKK